MTSQKRSRESTEEERKRARTDVEKETVESLKKLRDNLKTQQTLELGLLALKKAEHELKDSIVQTTKKIFEIQPTPARAEDLEGYWTEDGLHQDLYEKISQKRESDKAFDALPVTRLLSDLGSVYHRFFNDGDEKLPSWCLREWKEKGYLTDDTPAELTYLLVNRQLTPVSLEKAMDAMVVYTAMKNLLV